MRMRRRAFIGLLGVVTFVCPVWVGGQQKAMPVIGFLNGGDQPKWRHLVAAFLDGLRESGFIEGQNIAIEYRWAEGQWDRLPGLANDLISRQVAIIVAGGGDLPALAAKNATATTPIVYTSGGDPVKSGLVASLNHPGGNVTGVTSFTFALGPKRLEILAQLVPDRLIAVLANTNDPLAAMELEHVQSAAQMLRRQLMVIPANTEAEIEAAFVNLVQKGAGSLFVGSGAYFTAQRDKLVRLAARHATPAIYEQREFVESGGLISYGISFVDQYKKLGRYTARILNGAKPADLPVEQPTKFELVVNLKSAKALALTVPQSILAGADEIIE